MERGVAAFSPLDYAEFWIFPSQDRYEARVCSGNDVETIASGSLEQLLLHAPDVKQFCSQVSNSSFKIHPPENSDGAKWFTKCTFTRFFHVIGSSDILGMSRTVSKEISQLEDARKFHLSLYSKVNQTDHGSSKADRNGSSNITPVSDKADKKILSSDSTKNELLRAIDLRVTALRGELANTLNQVVGSPCSPEEIRNLENLSNHLGAVDLRNFCKLLELKPENLNIDTASDSMPLFLNGSKNDKLHDNESGTQICKLSQPDPPVKYGVSPAKVAQVERESSSDTEELSHSSEEDHPAAERSRTLIRAPSPRRSASPMRRIQIGRSGSRRAPSLTIKSLNYFPPRDKAASHRDMSADSDDEGSEQPTKRSENNARRMSVQDAINLFESKQRDQTVDGQKAKSSLNASITANKAVLRRWSAGMGEGTTHQHADVSEASAPFTSTGLGDDEDMQKSPPELGLESESTSDNYNPVLTTEKDTGPDSNLAGVDTSINPKEESSEKVTASVEWSRQREAEFNQLMMKMMESKPVDCQNASVDDEKSQIASSEKRGGFYDHYKVKRDEKLRGETTRKRAEKDAQIKAMQQILKERKAEMASTNTSDTGRRHAIGKPQKLHKSLSANIKEAPKPAALKKTSKANSLPPTRKSWPSTPSPRAVGTPPVKTPTGSNTAVTASTGTAPMRRKAQQATSLPRSSPKVDRSDARPKTVRATQSNEKSIKSNEKKVQTMRKNMETPKSKTQTAGDNPAMEKPSSRIKATKKSSVVPLETKTFLRKGSGTGHGAGSATKTKVSSYAEEPLETSGDICRAEQTEVVTNTSTVVQIEEKDPELPKRDANLELEAQLNSPQKQEENESSNNGIIKEQNNLNNIAGTFEVEKETIISPTAWVDEPEDHQPQPIPDTDITIQTASPGNVAPAGASSPRIRHSLSQMLLEESSETDIIEWGNAENPPAMIYQKDPPKGLKRLLKFARKSKADANLTGWSSPSTFSEGEDDADDSRASGKKNADSLLKKAALNAKNYGQQKATTSLSDTHKKTFVSSSSNISKTGAPSSYKLQDSSTTASSTKATRSFFSLSAFRGNKPNETKQH